MNPNSHLFVIAFVVMVGLGVAVHKGRQLFGKIVSMIKKFDQWMYDFTSDYTGDDSDQEALGAMDTESAKWAESERRKLEKARREDEKIIQRKRGQTALKRQLGEQIEAERRLKAEQWIQYREKRKALFGVGSHAWYIASDGTTRHIIVDCAPRQKNGKHRQVKGHFAARPNIRVNVSLYKLLTAKELKDPKKARFQPAA